MTRTPDYLVRNRRAWDKWSTRYEEAGRQGWETREITWGIWGIPETELRVLPDVAGMDVIELGCGTAYFSSWLARRGAHVVGIDNSPAQLANARRFQREFGLTFPLIQASAEAVPLPDAGFDLAISEYGAAIWSDPYLWVPEAARLLRPGGQLIFMVNATVLVLCMPEDAEAAATGSFAERLLRDAPLRVAGCGRGGGVPPRLRRLDPAAAAERVRDRRSDRGPRSRGGDDALRIRHRRVGAAMALRGDLEGAQAHVAGTAGVRARIASLEAP